MTKGSNPAAVRRTAGLHLIVMIAVVLMAAPPVQSYTQTATKERAMTPSVQPAASQSAALDKGSFPTVGIYISPPPSHEAHLYDFYKACGYNYLEFCEGGFGRRPDLLPAYHAKMAEAID